MAYNSQLGFALLDSVVTPSQTTTKNSMMTVTNHTMVFGSCLVRMSSCHSRSSKERFSRTQVYPLKGCRRDEMNGHMPFQAWL